MYKQRYDDYKYVMQDVYQLYLGVKYTFEEVVDNEDVPFKFRLILERYIYQDIDPQTTLESHFYYLGENGLALKIYKQIRLKVKFNVLEEKKSLTGRVSRQYTTRILPVEQFVRIPPEEKEKQGVVIQEISCSKLSMMAF